MEQYLFPLRERIPWNFFTHTTAREHVVPLTFNVYKKDAEEGLPESLDPVPGNGLVYRTNYMFGQEESASRFIEDVKAIAKKERHDPNVLGLWNRLEWVGKFERAANSSDISRQHGPAVHIEIQTHEAYVPDEVVDLRPNRLAIEKSFGKDLIVPGLTMRDIRFAMLVDELFRERYVPPSTSSTQFDQSGIISLLRPPKSPLTVEYVISAIFRRRFCPCCGLPHPLKECPDRKQNPPFTPCSFCQKTGHWSPDCLGKEQKVDEAVGK
ncbi:hypothetical protein GYMLUDRAFT_100148 [Collybiopsis luxurians FD-317 M1]|uniref:CCHC-type domain-containing protein n=1 Tax=Collybiopsis luxurians FD-317 M1 TaxID=944289 RepID=A0A0D0BWW2_9AGAR|nr:hypothetical protein GYMLUDRAFT_100148 [Collybiopsis luxurians FD-317 M1]